MEHTDICPCSTAPMTVQHTMQDCPLNHNQRLSTWPTDICPCSTTPMTAQPYCRTVNSTTSKGCQLGPQTYILCPHSTAPMTAQHSHTAGLSTPPQPTAVNLTHRHLSMQYSPNDGTAHTAGLSTLPQAKGVNLAHRHLSMQYSPIDGAAQTAGLSTLPQAKAVNLAHRHVQQCWGRFSAQWSLRCTAAFIRVTGVPV